jgi:hypothetical protein
MAKRQGSSQYPSWLRLIFSSTCATKGLDEAREVFLDRCVIG